MLVYSSGHTLRPYTFKVALHFSVTMNFVSFHSDRSDALTSEEIDMMYERQVAGTHNLSAIKFRLLSLIKILPRHVWNWPNNPYIGRVKRPDNPNIGRVK